MRLVPFCLALALAWGCGSSPESSIRPLGPDSVILAFGDSLTRGTGAPPEKSYPEVLSEALGLTVVNAGVPGEVSAEGRARIPGLLDRHQPDLVILCHGGNDFLRRLDEGRTRENISAMLDLIRSQGRDVVLIGVPRLGWGLSVPEFYAELAREHGCLLVPDLLLDILQRPELKSDMIHPNSAGYGLMAEKLAETIRRSGALP
ncbi:MAG: arylesterase [Deltaproteobacteria bacterium]|nr:arylesterase [Deltaproteobacteria bacterium]